MKTQTRRWTTALLCAVAVIMAVLVNPVHGQGQFTPYMATGPVYGSANYSTFLNTMDQAMEQGSSILNSTTPVSFIPQNGSIPVTQIFAYPNGVGSGLSAGAVLESSTLFTLSQISYLFSSPSWSFNGTFSGFNFGSGTVGIVWGPNGPGTDDAVYTSGSANNVLLNEAIIIGNTYTFNLSSGESVNDATSAFISSFGTQLPITAGYTLQGKSCSITTVVSTPEPSVLMLLASGGVLGSTMILKKLKN